MTKYTIRYNIGAYIYESVIWTSSSAAAMLWVETIGGSNPYVLEFKDETV